MYLCADCPLQHSSNSSWQLHKKNNVNSVVDSYNGLCYLCCCLLCPQQYHKPCLHRLNTVQSPHLVIKHHHYKLSQTKNNFPSIKCLNITYPYQLQQREVNASLQQVTCGGAGHGTLSETGRPASCNWGPISSLSCLCWRLWRVLYLLGTTGHNQPEEEQGLGLKWLAMLCFKHSWTVCCGRPWDPLNLNFNIINTPRQEQYISFINSYFLYLLFLYVYFCTFIWIPLFYANVHNCKEAIGGQQLAGEGE